MVGLILNSIRFGELMDKNLKELVDDDIDRKYIINAINPCSGNTHSHKDAVLFLAKDKAFLEGALPGYRQRCLELNANPAHIESIDLLIMRVKEYQERTESKTPDTDLPCEIRRCVDGEKNSNVETEIPITKEMLIQAWWSGFNRSAEGNNGEHCQTSNEELKAYCQIDIGKIMNNVNKNQIPEE